MSLFKNASPEYILLGADDKGSRALPATRDELPQHLPLIFTYARKGTTKKIVGSGALGILNYGAETFTPDTPYFKHTTRFATEVFGAGNMCALQRLVPTDAGPKSNIALYIDMVATTVPNYDRDANGNKIVSGNTFQVNTVTPTLPGVEIKFIIEKVTEPAMGMLVPKAGTMTGSTMYPIWEAWANEQGEYYNNIGFGIESIIGNDVDTDLLTSGKAMQYRLSLVTRENQGSAPQILRSLYGEPSVGVTLKSGIKHPKTKMKTDVSSVFESNWFNETDPLMTIRYKDYEGMYIYENNLELVLNAIMANEKGSVNNTNLSWFDYTTADPVAIDDDIHLINPFTCKSTKGIDYFTVVKSTATPTLAAGQREVHPGKNNFMFLEGGSDGTMDNAMFETLVGVEMDKYLDPDSQVIDNAVNVETHLYDTGFTVATKPKLLNFIGVRKDTVVALGTHDAEDKRRALSLADTRAIAVSLKTQAKLFPESDYFGTPVSRAIIASGTYKLYSDLDLNYVPLTFEVGIKTARMMGAGNYKWNAVHAFDHGANAVLKHGKDYQPEFIPAGIKATLWSVGMTWAQPKDRSTYFIPAIQTVYDDDTSPMNSWLTACALVTLNRISSDSWREFTGSSTMDDLTFIETVTGYLNDRIKGIFDGIMVVTPEVIISDADALRGYSWQVRWRLYSPNMKTKMVSSTEVYRLNDLAA